MGVVVPFKKPTGTFKKLNVHFDPPPKRANAVVAHYMTQEGQPYGSQRRCCELCHYMIGSGEEYTDNDQVWKSLKDDPNYIRCIDRKKP